MQQLHAAKETPGLSFLFALAFPRGEQPMDRGEQECQALHRTREASLTHSRIDPQADEMASKLLITGSAHHCVDAAEII